MAHQDNSRQIQRGGCRLQRGESSRDISGRRIPPVFVGSAIFEIPGGVAACAQIHRHRIHQVEFPPRTPVPAVNQYGDGERAVAFGHPQFDALLGVISVRHDRAGVEAMKVHTVDREPETVETAAPDVGANIFGPIRRALTEVDANNAAVQRRIDLRSIAGNDDDLIGTGCSVDNSARQTAGGQGPCDQLLCGLQIGEHSGRGNDIDVVRVFRHGFTLPRRRRPSPCSPTGSVERRGSGVDGLVQLTQPGECAVGEQILAGLGRDSHAVLPQ